MKLILFLLLTVLACQGKETVIQERQIPGPQRNLPAPSVPDRVDFMSLDILEDSILLDLNTLSDVERINSRYFVNCGEYNAGERDMRAFQAAANKMINSLSTESSLEAVKPIAPTGCLSRIDLRDYGLTTSEWKSIANNLLLRFISESSRGQQIQFLTQALQPYVFTNDFAVTSLGADALTSSNGLYYKLLEQPFQLDDFFRDIGADPQRSADDEETILSAFSGSIIALGKTRSLQLIEDDNSHVITSFDSSLDQADDHFQNPFTLEVALAQGLRRTNKIFNFNAQEHIYFLDNGMLGYRLNGAAGTQEFVAPNNVVINNLAAARQLDPTIHIGSCMGCHFEPMIQFRDQLNQHIATNPAFNALEKELGQVFFNSGRAEGVTRSINQEHQEALRKIGASSSIDQVHEKLIFPLRVEQGADQVCGYLLLPRNTCLQRIRGSAISSQVFGNLLNGNTVSLAVLSQNFNQLVIDTQAFRDGSL
jgi:hypothetical protein